MCGGGGGFFPEMAMAAGGGMMNEAMGGMAAGVGSGGLQEVERVRSVFPETWLWTNASVR